MASLLKASRGNKFIALAIMALSPVAQLPAFAAGPNVLEHGESVTFPTWAGDSETTLCVKSLSDSRGVRVHVNVGAGHEDIYAQAGKANCIKRKWWGVQAGVTNTSDQSDVAAEVWTH